jgi:hypothetical protein
MDEEERYLCGPWAPVFWAGRPNIRMRQNVISVGRALKGKGGIISLLLRCSKNRKLRHSDTCSE